MKWNNFKSALFENRTDIALVRLTPIYTLVRAYDDAEARLIAVQTSFASLLVEYVPN